MATKRKKSIKLSDSDVVKVVFPDGSYVHVFSNGLSRSYSADGVEFDVHNLKEPSFNPGETVEISSVAPGSEWCYTAKVIRRIFQARPLVVEVLDKGNAPGVENGALVTPDTNEYIKMEKIADTSADFKVWNTNTLEPGKIVDAPKSFGGVRPPTA